MLGNTLDDTGQCWAIHWTILVRKDSGGRTLNRGFFLPWETFASIHDGDEEEFVIVMSAQVE